MARTVVCFALLAVACEGRGAVVRGDPGVAADAASQEQLSEHRSLAEDYPAIVAFLDTRLAVLQRLRVIAEVDAAFTEPWSVDRGDAGFGVVHVHERMKCAA